MPFCETNPPFLDGIFGVIINGYGSCAGNLPKKSVGSFWKTNPILEPKVGVFTENEPKMGGKTEWIAYTTKQAGSARNPSGFDD